MSLRGIPFANARSTTTLRSSSAFLAPSAFTLALSSETTKSNASKLRYSGSSWKKKTHDARVMTSQTLAKDKFQLCNQTWLRKTYMDTYTLLSSKLIMEGGCREHYFNLFPNGGISVCFRPQLTSERLGFYECAARQNGSGKWS